MFENAILLHDLGKKSRCFQAKKMQNKKFKEYEKCGDSSHSKGGTLEYIRYYKKQIDKFDGEEFYILIFILYAFSYTISKHHGKLANFEEYFSQTKEEMETHLQFNNAKTCINECLDKNFELYILSKLLFSLLISSDYYATTEYMAFKNEKKFDSFGLFASEQKDDLKSSFDLYIKKFGKPTGINILRDEISKSAHESLNKNLDKHIFYLEAPTGSGKTLTSINLALTLLKEKDKLDKLFYVFPFNALTEQTKQVFDEIFADILDIGIINSITPIKDDGKQEDEESNYNHSYVGRLFYHLPAIITTHVNFFNVLFGTSKEDNFPLWQFANSVIILDEIQSYKNNLWWYMIEFFEKYAKLLNIKIIIMSATLPKLDYFLDKSNSFVDLISKDKRDEIFSSEYFRNRVNIEYLNIDKKITLEELREKLLEESKRYNKILFEFISKKTARKFYNLIKNDFKNIHELSGDDNKAYRQKLINRAKNDKSIIIIATQVIEAGVDIDMDLGFKDISTLDSEEQFMGRINRSCKKENAKVYFFDLDDEKQIYKGDNRLGYDLRDKKYQEILQNKDFEAYYKNVLIDIQSDNNRLKDGTLTDYKKFTENVQKLNYNLLSKTMTLISSETFTLYFPFKIDISKYDDVKEFKHLENVFLSDGELDGQKVWNEFLQLNKIDNFAKKEVIKSKIKSLMQFFTFNIFKHYEADRPFIGEDMYGFYFVKEWKEFITDDYKFDREKYNEINNGYFL